ncbi:hypothetical protein E2C01_003754 [Portunus trituberculatus]|uniref:Uncharacterized protein n=1 Tax=Portunus trituberculatus TaxID=210409 RepID=A0A5B7CQL7_PORTR|nr:hypothetical protein [Portunus trituberculatus]
MAPRKLCKSDETKAHILPRHHVTFHFEMMTTHVSTNILRQAPNENLNSAVARIPPSLKALLSPELKTCLIPKYEGMLAYFDLFTRRIEHNLNVFCIHSCCEMVEERAASRVPSSLLHKLVKDELLDTPLIMSRWSNSDDEARKMMEVTLSKH